MPGSERGVVKKPDRVEVGQWWVELDGGAPFRVAHNTPEWNQQAWLSGPFAYLGSGDHPEPSEWMIETLAEHAYHVDGGRSGPIDGALAESYRDVVRRIPLDGPDRVRPVRELAVRSLYSILRSLGKW